MPEPAWPSSGVLLGGPPEDAPAAAQRFINEELGITSPVTVGELEVTGASCQVRIEVDGRDGAVYFHDGPDGVVPSGFGIGGDAGLSLSVRGRHVTAVYAPECAACASFEMRVRYGDALAQVPPQPGASMVLNLPADPSVTGGYVYLARAGDGSISYALANMISAGDFAAS